MHLDAGAAAHQANYRRINRQLAGHLAAIQQIQFSQRTDLQALVHQRRAAGLEIFTVGQVKRDLYAALAVRQIGIEPVVLLRFGGFGPLR